FVSFAILHKLYRDYDHLFQLLFFPHNCIVDLQNQSYLIELLPYLMQLLFDSLGFLAINFSVACICSLCQLIDVITNRSQLLCYLNRPRFINLGGLHAIPQCPLFRKSWHTHMKIVRCLLQFFIFVVAHTKFNLSIIFPVLSHKSHFVLFIFHSPSQAFKCVLIIHILSCFLGSGKLYIWYPNKLVFAVAKMPPNPHLHGGIKTLPFFKKATPKTFTYQAPNPRIFGGSLAGRQVEKMVFRQAKRVLL